VARAAIRGYFAALAAGNLIFWASGLIRFLILGPRPGDNVGFAGFLVVFVFTLVVSLITTMLPFIALLAISLMFKIRSWPYFVACGIAIGLLNTGLVIGAGWTDRRMWALNATLWQHLSASGALGGFVYWWVAVRGPGRAAGAP